jgi:histone-lysine N-methyltransferase SETD2
MESPSQNGGNGVHSSTSSTSHSPRPKNELSTSSDIAMKEEPDSKDIKDIKQERPKLSRSASSVSRPPPLYTHLPDSTQDALATFDQIPACIYANKYMGYTELAMECDCAEEWGKLDSEGLCPRETRHVENSGIC